MKISYAALTYGLDVWLGVNNDKAAGERLLALDHIPDQDYSNLLKLPFILM